MLNYCTSGSLVRCVFSRTGVKRIPAGVITTFTMANVSSNTPSVNNADTVEKVSQSQQGSCNFKSVNKGNRFSC